MGHGFGICVILRNCDIIQDYCICKQTPNELASQGQMNAFYFCVADIVYRKVHTCLQLRYLAKGEVIFQHTVHRYIAQVICVHGWYLGCTFT